MNSDLRDQQLHGILMMLLAVAAFSFMDAGLKALSTHYPALQVAALRAWASLPVIIVWVALSGRGSFKRLLKVRWTLHLLRGVLGIAMLAGFAYAVRSLPLSEAYAIFFAAPLLITALAAPLLGERVTANRWLAIIVGLVGVLVVLRPGGDQLLSWAGLAGLLAALCYALSAITARVLGRTDSSISMVFWLMLMIAVGATVLNGSHWVAVRPEHGWILLGIALTGALGQYAVTEAFTRGQASLIAPFEYTALAWGCGLDWLIWATLPGYWVWVGAAIIIASGLYLLWSERRMGAARRRAEAAEMAAVREA